MTIHRRSLRNHRALIQAHSGFSLSELLVAVVITAIVAIMTSQVMINQLFQERRIELAQRLREDVSRLNYLVQIEASEAETIAYGGTAVCTGNGVPAPNAGSLITFLVPPPSGTYQNDNLRRSVQYFNAPYEGVPSIWRCGPKVSRNGVLLFGDAGNVAGVVLRNAQLTLNPAGCEASTDRSVTYQVSTTTGLAGGGSGNIGALGGCTTAYARSVFVCNPPIGAAAIGDC